MSELVPPPEDAVRPVKLRSALKERCLAHALSTITRRAWPDVRDGSARDETSRMSEPHFHA